MITDRIGLHSVLLPGITLAAIRHPITLAARRVDWMTSQPDFGLSNGGRHYITVNR